MKKTAIFLSILLILAIGLGLTACGDKSADKASGKSDSSAVQETEAATEAEPIDGVKVGDTFEYSGRTITLTEIREDADEAFITSGTPSGKWVTLCFSVGAGSESFGVDIAGISINGTAASDAVGKYTNGMVAKCGSSLLTTDTMSFMVLFDIDAATPLDQLGLTVNG